MTAKEYAGDLEVDLQAHRKRAEFNPIFWPTYFNLFESYCDALAACDGEIDNTNR